MSLSYLLPETQAHELMTDKTAGNQGRVAVANHLFVNNVRFLSMAAIIAVHTLGAYGRVVHRLSLRGPLLYLQQPFKFGTIAFFLVSGFLFGDRIHQYGSLQYFGRRLRNIFVPWVVWFSLFCIPADAIHGRLVNFADEYALCRDRVLNSSYWFVPNLLIALGLLLLFRPLLHRVGMGLVFLLASLFYGVNIYGHWIAVEHTRAVFGFVFYLWLGAWSARHFSTLEKWLARVPTGAMAGMVVATMMLALWESKLLVALGSVDPVNSLRVSNQLYSVVVVLALVKLRHAVWPRFVNVREHTFGLYLTHTVGLGILYKILNQTLPRFGINGWWTTGLSALVLIPTIFVLAYGGCLLVVRFLLAHPYLRWTVGPLLRRTGGGGPRGSEQERRPAPHRAGRALVLDSR